MPSIDDCKWHPEQLNPRALELCDWDFSKENKTHLNPNMENGKGMLYPKLDEGEMKAVVLPMKMDSDISNGEMKNKELSEKADNSEEEDMSTCAKIKRGLKKNILLILLIVSMLLGIALGAGLRFVEPKFDNRQIMYLRFPGDMLMNMLKMLILPLIVSSLISGLSSLDTRASGRMGLRAVVYYLTTTLVAVVLGIILTLTIQPGSRAGTPDASGESKVVHPADTFLDLLRYVFTWDWENLLSWFFSSNVALRLVSFNC